MALDPSSSPEGHERIAVLTSNTAPSTQVPDAAAERDPFQGERTRLTENISSQGDL